MNLYKELDQLETEEKLIQFREDLTDRFGSLPPQTEALLNTIRLRWLARKTGFEKIVLRNNRLTCYFIANQESPYFQSVQFSAILQFMKSNPGDCIMKEERNRLFLTFRNVENIDQALEKLNRIPLTENQMII
jgi:transcription-repair coupling factor (superfamily II helicase)